MTQNKDRDMIARSDCVLEPGLYLVATPIGHLRDITLRALDVLGQVDQVLVEDSRVSAKLFSAYGLKPKTLRYDEHTDARQRPKILKSLEDGQRLALISDAGTPLVSDPGSRLVRAVLDAGHRVFAIPGPCAAIAALCISGLATDHFLFAGFAPTKSGARKTFFRQWRDVQASVIVYETGPRLVESLIDMQSCFGDRQAIVARELTKIHETILRNSLSELAKAFTETPPKGELVVIVEAAEPCLALPSQKVIDAMILEGLQADLPLSEAVYMAAKTSGISRKVLYSRALELKGQYGTDWAKKSKD